MWCRMISLSSAIKGTSTRLNEWKTFRQPSRTSFSDEASWMGWPEPKMEKKRKPSADLFAEAADLDGADEEQLVEQGLEGEARRVPLLAAVAADLALGAPLLAAVAHRDLEHVARTEAREALQTCSEPISTSSMSCQTRIFHNSLQTLARKIGSTSTTTTTTTTTTKKLLETFWEQIGVRVDFKKNGKNCWKR